MEQTELSSRVLIYNLLLSAVAGLVIGYVGAHMDPIYLAVLTVITYCGLMFLGIPPKSSSLARKFFNMFCLVSLPTAWGAYYVLM
jgi:hypothetical protein